MPTFPEGAVDVLDPAGLERAVAHVSLARELAVDVEADAMHAFRARLCFVQLGTDDQVFLLDTLQPGVSVAPLARLFGDPARVKFFHAAGGDLQYLAEAGVRVKGLFDTHRAATLLGWAKVGLADLARERLSVELKKEHQQSDFSKRPMPDGMRDYIADDVRYLCEIGRQVRDECVKADILEEVMLDCERLCDEAVGRPEIAPFKPKFNRQGIPPKRVAAVLAVAEALHQKRLAWAEAANVPMGRMLSNAAVTAIATELPKDLKTLSRLEGVRGPFAREHGEEVLKLCAELLGQAERGELQAPASDGGARDPKRKKREEALKLWRSQKATERKVTPSVVLTNPLLDELSRTPPQSPDDLAKVPYFGEKRVRLYGPELVTLVQAVK